MSKFRLRNLFSWQQREASRSNGQEAAGSTSRSDRNAQASLDNEGADACGSATTTADRDDRHQGNDGRFEFLSQMANTLHLPRLRIGSHAYRYSPSASPVPPAKDSLASDDVNQRATARRTGDATNGDSYIDYGEHEAAQPQKHGHRLQRRSSGSLPAAMDRLDLDNRDGRSTQLGVAALSSARLSSSHSQPSPSKRAQASPSEAAARNSARRNVRHRFEAFSHRLARHLQDDAQRHYDSDGGFTFANPALHASQPEVDAAADGRKPLSQMGENYRLALQLHATGHHRQCVYTLRELGSQGCVPAQNLLGVILIRHHLRDVRPRSHRAQRPARASAPVPSTTHNGQSSLLARSSWEGTSTPRYDRATIEGRSTTVHDLREGLKWLQRAALKHDRNALHNLGIVFEHAIGVNFDPDRARRFYERAARRGVDEARYRLACMHVQEAIDTQLEYERFMHEQEQRTIAQGLRRHAQALEQQSGRPSHASPRGRRRVLLGSATSLTRRSRGSTPGSLPSLDHSRGYLRRQARRLRRRKAQLRKIIARATRLCRLAAPRCPQAEALLSYLADNEDVFD